MAERAGLLHASGVAAAQPREPGCPRRRWARRTRVGPGVPWGTLATLAESRWPQQALPDMSEKSEGSLKSGSPRAPPLPRDALGEPSAALRVSSAREGGPVGETGRWGQHLGRPPRRLSAAPARQPRRLEPDPRPAARLADDKSELEGSTLSVLSAASSASRRLPPQEQLREKAFEYCQRLIEQSNRRESPGAVPAPARSRLGRWPEAGAPQLLFPRGIFVFRPEPLGAQHWTEAVPGLWGAVSPSVSPFSCPPWGQLPAVPPPTPSGWLAAPFRSFQSTAGCLVLLS